MFALWYFSLALDEVRKRFSFVDRIVTFFTGKSVSEKQPPAIEPVKPDNTKPTESDASSTPEPAPPKDTPAAPPKVSPAAPSKPAEKPVLKPAPAPPSAVKPVEPPKTTAPEPKPKVELPPTPELKPEQPKEQPKPVSVPKVDPVTTPKPLEPATTNGQPKAPEPAAKVAPAELLKLTDESSNTHPSAASIAVELPGSNEDSFIIVEKQKPKSTDSSITNTTNVKNSTLDFLKAEGGRGAAAVVAGPATPR